MKPEFAEAIQQIADEAEAGTLLSVAWIAQREGVKRRFGHIGYSDGREVLTDSLINLRGGIEPKPQELN